MASKQGGGSQFSPTGAGVAVGAQVVLDPQVVPMKVYPITEPQFDQISLLNTFAYGFFSAGSIALTSAIGLWIAIKTSTLSQSRIDVLMPVGWASIGIATVLYVIGGWIICRYRGEVTKIKNAARSINLKAP